MGNQSSQPSNDFQKQFTQLKEQLKYQQHRANIDIHKLQQQIYYTQLKMQEMKKNQHQPSQYQQPHQNGGGSIGSGIVNILSNPEIKSQMANNPAFGVQMIELILKEYGTQLSDNQYNKINEYLEKQTQSIQYSSNQQYQQKQQHQQQMMVHSTANMSLNDRYSNDEDVERRKFEEEQQQRRRQFEEQQRRRKAEYAKQIRDFEQNNNVNSYKLLGVSANYTLDELKVAYRKKAIQTHPDKGGNPEVFDAVTKAYFSLLEKLKNKEQDKQYGELKSQSKQYIEGQSSDKRKNVNLKDEKFNLTAFNKIFEENKIADPTDNGYDEWLKDESSRKEQPKIFSDKFNLDVFNSTFENWKDEDSNLNREIVLRDEPSALVAFGRTGYTELGVDKVNDFSNAEGRGLGYTDLKQAYSKSGIINTKQVQMRESYRNIQEYEKARSKVEYKMSPEDIRREELRKRKEEEEEKMRIQRVQQRDNQHFNSYNRVHQLMLEKLK